MLVVLVIVIFFIVSSLVFSGRLAEGILYLCMERRNDVLTFPKITPPNLGKSNGGC